MVEGLEGGLHGGKSPAHQRLTVPEAARELGITEAAVRGRIKRGTLRSHRESGKVYVLLRGAASKTNRDAPTDQSELIAVLREQLAEEREARRRADTIIAQLTQANATLAARIPELEAPASEAAEPQESPETAGEEPTGTAPPPEPEEATSRTQEEQRSWWRRIFGP